MACYVFGNAITNETLSELPKYHDKAISRLDRAREAYKMKNSEGKDTKARNFVDNLYRDWINFIEKEKEDTTFNHKLCYLVLIYNATGDTLSYVTSQSFTGTIGRSPYPARIENGQWAGFLHAHDFNTCTRGSMGAVVYRGRTNEGTELDWLVGWKNPGGDTLGHCKVYGEASDKGHYTRIWGDVYEAINLQGDLHSYFEPISGESYGAVIEVTTGSHAAPLCEAIITLQNVIGVNN